MAHFSTDLEAYFNTERFSDVELEIIEDFPELKGKRKRGVTIPGHSMVLLLFSNYCKVKLENWSPERDQITLQNVKTKTPKQTKRTIQLPVPTGQTDIATRLIQGIYQKSPTVSGLSQQQQLQLLLLADRFEVPKVQAAVLDALKVLSADDLNWGVALALLDLPFSSDTDVTCKQVVAKAEGKLLQQLGDLEMVWADEQLQDKLLNLPHAALLHLVQHDQTRVASESTVVFTILQWWEKQLQSYRNGHIQQLKQLMQQVRMQHLSSVYVSTYMLHSQTVLLCFSPQELALACTCTDPGSLKVLQDAAVPELQHYRAWTAAKRPASRRTPSLEWRLPLAELERAVTDALHDNRYTRPVNGLVEIIRGHQFRLAAVVQTYCSTDATGVECESSSADDLLLAIFMTLPRLAPGAVCNISYDSRVRLAASQQPNMDVVRGLTSTVCRGGQGVCGPCVAFALKSISSWSDAKARLEQKGLVHADGCLHITCRIWNVT